MKIYTKGGDKGVASLYNGERCAKGSLVFSALGDVDELNSVLGMAREHVEGLETIIAEQVSPGTWCIDSAFSCLSLALSLPGSLLWGLRVNSAACFERLQSSSDEAMTTACIHAYLLKASPCNLSMMSWRKACSCNLYNDLLWQCTYFVSFTLCSLTRYSPDFWMWDPTLPHPKEHLQTGSKPSSLPLVDTAMSFKIYL